MENYLFWVTVKVQHNGKPFETRVVKGCRSESDHLARRFVLNQMLEKGYHVTNIDKFKNPHWT